MLTLQEFNVDVGVGEWQILLLYGTYVTLYGTKELVIKNSS